ncbi:MAG: T9SS type A sorting domain-containing protein [Flavobacteriales bacterium]|nr:T9SS type A sorting domain-containing protein [Flavobacteriales bacterium]
MDIFPNPCTTQATVDWPSGTPVEQCTLTDASGRVVRQWNPRTLTAAQHTFSVVDLSSGMYSLQVRAKDGVRSGRILVAP